MQNATNDSGQMAGLISRFEWAATPLGAIESWPQSLKTAVDIMLGSGHAMQLAWGPERTVLYNDAYAPMLGARHPGALGLPFREAWPDIWDQIERLVSRVFAGETVRFEDMPLVMTRHGYPEDTWWDFSYSPVRDESGAVAGLLNVTVDSTGRIRAERAEHALRESEERLGLAIEIGEMASWDWDLRSGEVTWNDRHFLMQGYGVNEVPPSYEAWLARVHPEDREDAIALIEKARASRSTYVHEFRICHADGKVVWCSARGRFFYQADGQPYRMVGVMEDVTARKETELTLRETQERHTFLLKLSDTLRALADPGTIESTASRLLAEHVGANRSLYLELEGEEATRFAVGRRVANLGPQRAAAREWTPSEVQLVEEVADRTRAAVERARAEAALRESEERFRQFAAASSGALWIRNADTFDMEYVSPAITTIYGVEKEKFLGDMKLWAAQIVPEDRDIALEHIERARKGESVVHEFRIQRPSDKAFRWIRNTDFPLRDERGRIQRVGGIAEDVTEAKLAVEHQGVLLAELQHRVRNIMAIIRSITARTAENAADVPDYATRMSGRLLALARVQALLTRAANAKVGIRSLVQDEVSVQAHQEGQYILEGPDVELSPKAAEVLTLAVHELATNALKHGALSVPNGKVSVTWKTVEKHDVPWLVFDWTEQGAPESPKPAPGRPRRQGFGSELIEGRIPYELKGRGRLVIEPGGARCHLEFPLKEGASVLETGAPQRATVFGGALDMTGEADLSGYRVLVVEDDYYLATDAARALRGAGAEVMGPSSTEEAARAELLVRRPHAVLLDINLGPGPSFKLAEKLLDDGIPFVFVTGYDQEVIPPEFAGVKRLEKPIQLRQIVSAIKKLVTST